MKFHLFLPVIILFAFLFQYCEITETYPPRTTEEEIRTIVQQQMTQYGVPGVQVCVYNPARNQLIQVSEGVMDKTAGTKVTNSTQFFIGSNTKSFTAQSILMLMEQGKLSLNDSIGQYISFDSDTLNRVTIVKLMNMHSGLRGYIDDDIGRRDSIILAITRNPSHHFPPRELVRYAQVLNTELGLKPDSEFHYSNTNYIMLGMLIEAVSGMSYEAFIAREIIDPLGLRHTFAPTGSNYGAAVSKGYLIDKSDNTEMEISGYDMSYVWSAGSILSTARDLCYWMQAVGNHTLLDEAAAKWLYDGFPTGRGADYTAGLLNEPGKLSHNGTVIGFHSEMCYLKKSGVSIAVLSNCNITGTDDDPVKNIIRELENLFQ